MKFPGKSEISDCGLSLSGIPSLMPPGPRPCSLPPLAFSSLKRPVTRLGPTPAPTLGPDENWREIMMRYNWESQNYKICKTESNKLQMAKFQGSSGRRGNLGRWGGRIHMLFFFSFFFFIHMLKKWFLCTRAREKKNIPSTWDVLMNTHLIASTS